MAERPNSSVFLLRKVDFDSNQVLPQEHSPAGLTAFRQKLVDRLKAADVLVRPRRRGYADGEVIEREVFGLCGESLGLHRFIIQSSPGSGFAGQVYQAFPCGQSSAQGAGDPVAIKVLKPRSRWKEGFRELLFRLCFQASYAARLRTEAVRSGLLWQALLYQAAGAKFRSETGIARPYGYFWDTELGSYAEIHAWVSGRSSRYEIEERRPGQPAGSHTEMGRKRRFMLDLVRLCRAMGAEGLSRQFEWYTFVAQSNVLTRRGRTRGETEFSAVDFRPGLAVPFFLPLSPAHARLIWQGWQKGSRLLFDQADLAQLDSYLSAHRGVFSDSGALIQQLKADEAVYRAGLPSLWQGGFRWAFDPRRRQVVRAAVAADWEKLEKISPGWAQRLQKGYGLFFFCWSLDNLPILGGRLLRWLANDTYRSHLFKCLASRAYRRSVLGALQARDVLEWENRGRVSTGRAVRLSEPGGFYLVDKILLSWLSAGLHRFLTDSQARREFFQGLVFPLNACFSYRYQEAWLRGMIESGHSRGLLSADECQRLQAQAGEERMRGYLRDLGLTIGLDALAKLLYLVLAAYGLSTRNFWPLGIAMLGPISPTGVVRAGYILAQLPGDVLNYWRNKDRRQLGARLLALLTAPWRFIGNLYAPLEMVTYYRRLSLLIANYYTTRLVNAIPVLGGEGKLLDYWAFLLLYNFPLSVLKRILRPAPAGSKL